MLCLCEKRISSQIPSCYNITDCCKVQEIANHLMERVPSGVAQYLTERPRSVMGFGADA